MPRWLEPSETGECRFPALITCTSPRRGPADVSLVAAMRYNAFAYVADNLYVGVVMETEASVRRDLISFRTMRLPIG